MVPPRFLLHNQYHLTNSIGIFVFFPELYNSPVVPNYGQYYTMDLRSWCYVFYNVCLSIINAHLGC